MATDGQRWALEAERELRADYSRGSFWYFLQDAFGIAHNPAMQRWLTPRVHHPLARWLQEHAETWLARRRAGIKEITYLLVVVPRNFGKTTIGTRAFPLWLSLLDPDLSVYIGSENLESAVAFFKPLRSILDGEDPYAKFTWLYGNYYDKNRPWSTDELVHAARQSVARPDPSLGVWGVESGLTGCHPDVLILDDPTSYEKMASQSNWLQIVNDHVDSLTPVINPDGMMMFVGTRYHDGDHLGRAIREQGVASVSGMTPPGGIVTRKDGKWHLFFMAARDEKNKSVFPEVWSDQRLKDYEKDKNLYYWAQMMNDPASSEFNPLTRAQVEELWIEDKDVPRNLRYTVHMDTAFKTPTRQARGDESVIQVWGHARDGSGEVYFIEGHGSNVWRMDDFLRLLVQILQRYKASGRRISMMTDEREMGGKEGLWEGAIRTACASTHKVTMPPLLQLTRGDKKKIGRIVQAASYWAEGFVHLPRTAPGVARLVDQMTRIGASAHDDWADAGSDVFHEEVYRVTRSIEKDVQPPSPVRPGDDVLKRQWQLDQAAIEAYDRHYDRTEHNPYEPV